MVVAITFDHKQKHKVELDQGRVKARPAIPATAGLYIIRNTGDNATVYVGTSSNLKVRFKVRLEVYRESGFTQTELDTLRIYQVKVKVDDFGRSVDDQGLVYTPNGYVDAEHLLIRSVIAKAHKTVRNVEKWGYYFANNLGTRLDVEFENFPNSIDPWIPADFSVANNAMV